jgi:hypothetical protein
MTKSVKREAASRRGKRDNTPGTPSAYRPARRVPLLLVTVAIVLPSPTAITGIQHTRVASTATDIRSFRLSVEHLRKLTLVTQAMDRLPPRGPEAPRSDVATFTMLSMSLSFNEPFTERTVPEVVRTIQRGHPELATAVQEAGLPLADYVLTQITLLLTYPVIAAERQGRSAGVADDVSPANLAFVRANWNQIEKALKALSEAAAPHAR